jgi:hypothetical protein
MKPEYNEETMKTVLRIADVPAKITIMSFLKPCQKD